MSEASTEGLSLERECRALTRYLVGMQPTAYVVGRYVAAHASLGSLEPVDAFDRLLVRLGTGAWPMRALATSFARLHAPHSALQGKLVTLLAILETAPPSTAKIDAVPSSNVPWLLTLLAVRGGFAAVSALVGTLLLWPLRLVMAGR